MANIKDLAARAGVSPSTASIVVNGKGEERKISQETQDKVWRAAKEIGYRPNISARRLRDQNTLDSMMIAVYWSSDFRANLMVRFLRGLQTGMLNQKKTCEFLIHPYKNHHLKEAAGIAEVSKYHAVIICNASEQDIAYLEETHFPVPVILYNRESEQYSTVTVDDERIGQIPAEVFHQHHCKSALLVGESNVFPGMKKRVDGFLHSCKTHQIATHIVDCPLTMKGGYAIMEEIHREQIAYDCIFALSDYPAIGILRYCLEHNIALPKDIEMIAVGNADDELEEYAAIPLSVVELPMEDMAAACLQMAINSIELQMQEPQKQQLGIQYIARKTTAES